MTIFLILLGIWFLFGFVALCCVQIEEGLILIKLEQLFSEGLIFGLFILCLACFIGNFFWLQILREEVENG